MLALLTIEAARPPSEDFFQQLGPRKAAARSRSHSRTVPRSRRSRLSPTTVARRARSERRWVDNGHLCLNSHHSSQSNMPPKGSRRSSPTRNQSPTRSSPSRGANAAANAATTSTSSGSYTPMISLVSQLQPGLEELRSKREKLAEENGKVVDWVNGLKTGLTRTKS